MLSRGGRRGVCLLAQALSHDAGRGWGVLASDNLPKGFRSWPGSHLADAAPVTTAVGTWSMYGQAAFFASKGGKQGGKGAKEAVQAPQEVQEWDIEPFVTQMGEALDHLRRKLAGIRTGRASPGLLEAVSVEARSSGSSHGPHVPLRVLGTVVARGPQLLVVELYDKEDDKAVAKAIQNSPLKLQARAENGEVLVPVPRLSLEMVKGFVKLAAQEAEAARKAVRAVRHRALEQAKLCNTGGPAGELKRMEQQVQALTDKHIREVDGLLRAKERDLQEHH
ncbi:hypothetical protein CHLRE_12g545177v5 [Chlamydomonas reinhardtii]|uniref:Ribosome-recycling factor, chloroplastic n=1 Tax=Chlamydomonas reinhardtii TaxID=3055 RepID=A0A2K3D720_CHLRE|nr:uncharacterized protein CHLRE_12g545177v5 [Chlamydomonas reinhardtii]PNW76326.1 hypothetical protein CHLRE_12g545177v5 [Chlamydomonas reinhardtii]